MPKENFIEKIRNPKFILGLILAVFFFKGLFLATIHPLFDGQDEARHYATIQFLAEPAQKTWGKTERPHIRNKEKINDYNFSEEMIKSGQAADFDKWRHSLYETMNFSENFNGKNEQEIKEMKWKPYNNFLPPDVVSGSLYHTIGAKIENLLQNQNILIRFYSIRIFSVFLGTLAIFIAYLIMKNVGFKPKVALLLTTIVAFQPKFSDYMTNINYDALTIPMFFLFTLGGVLALKNGLNWKNLMVMIFAAYVAFEAKGTGVVLFGIMALLLLYFIHEKIKSKSINFRRAFTAFFALTLAIIFTYFKKYLPLQNGFRSALNSLLEYLDESLTMGRFALSSRTYWGSLSWVDSWTLSNFTNLIWIVEIFAILGLTLYLISKNKPAWLPDKKYVIFFIGMLISLQLGIRTYDWNIYAANKALDLGTPGRYFLPNLVSHVILVFTGLGMLLHKFKKDAYFETVLAGGLVLMFSLSMYLIFDVLIYRFYL